MSYFNVCSLIYYTEPKNKKAYSEVMVNSTWVCEVSPEEKFVEKEKVLSLCVFV